MTALIRLGLSGALLLSTLVVLESRPASEAVPTVQPLDSVPMLIGAWQGRETTVFEAASLDTLKVTDYLMRRYTDGSRSLWLYVGYWAVQPRGVRIYSPKNCLPASGWEPIEASRVEIPVSPSARISVNRYLVQKDQEQQLVFYWYQYRGKVIADEASARFELLRNATLHNRTDGAIIRLNVPIGGDLPTTATRLVTFIQMLYPILNRYLPD